MLTEAGKVSLNFKHGYLDDNSRAWDFSFFDSTESELSTDKILGQSTSLNSINVYLGAGTYYVRVKTGWYHSSIDYTLTVNFTQNNGEYEIEYNNTKATATTMNVNKPITGNLYKSDDVDYYKFTTTSAGRISLNLKHGYLDDDSRAWNFALFDSTDTELSNDTILGQTTLWNSMNLYLGAGTYYVRVKNGWYQSTTDYTLAVDFAVNTGAYEIESNSNRASATAMSVNMPITGNLHISDDVDFYKFTTTSAGKISLSFKHEYLDDNSRGWGISLFDNTETEISTYTCTGNTASLNTINFYLGAGTYHVRVKNGWYHSSLDYTLTVNYTKNTGAYEIESNNAKAKATTLGANKTITGNICSREDVDYYKVTIAKDSELTIGFTHPNLENSSEYWNITVFNNSGKEQLSFNSVGNKAIMKSQKTVVKKGTYYVRVQKSWSHSDADYKLIVNTKPAVKVTKIKLNKTSVTMKAKTSWWSTYWDPVQLKATVSPKNASDKKVTWKSSKPNVASVDATGKVTAHKKGTAVITCKAADGSGKTAKCKIKVR